MNTEVRKIDGAEAERLARLYIPTNATQLRAIHEICDACDPAVSVWLGETLLCLGGFYPVPDCPGTAFVWMQHTLAAFEHPIAIIRTGRAVLEVAMTHYPRVIGTCSLGARSEAWLQSLGAKFMPNARTPKPFIIESPAHG
jgi:hypothetical protein